jgi:RiboL-PSP-HEPN
MLPANVASNRSRIDSIIAQMDLSIHSADMRIQNVFSSHLVILASGHIEISVREIVSSYVNRRTNPKINKFILKTLERENSLNCDKICKILDKFDPIWKDQLAISALASEKEAVDSLKTLRDQIAHGKANGTGYMIVKQYFQEGCKYLVKLNQIIK